MTYARPAPFLRRPRKSGAALLLMLVLCASGNLLARETPVAAPALQQEVERIAAMLPGEIGIGLVHLESGRTAFVNPDQGFPMASTMKVPVAVHILKLVDEGQLSLQQQVLLQDGDVYPQMGGPMDLHLTAGSAITIRDLLHMMITVSDNNATDILIRVGGGTDAVTRRMRSLGIEGLRVDRFIWELLANYRGHEASQQAPISPADYGTLSLGERSEELRRQHTDLYNADPRDTSSARAMATLLQKAWNGEVLSEASTRVLQDIMRATRTGGDRLKGMLPPSTPIAHKTGTVGDVINDVGVITLPDGQGHVIATVFIKSRASTAARDGTIAQVARAAHDYFLFVR